MITVLQGSDLQYGAPYRPEVGRAFTEFAAGLEPALIVVAGDLTQRARSSEFRGVQEFFDDLPDVPVVVTPGNHDVPLYRVWERIARPYRNWKRFISEDLNTVTRIEGATVVALNSSAPRRKIVAGYIGGEQVAWAEEQFEAGPADDLRLLVIHHHFIATEDRLGGAPLEGGAGILREFERMGVDAIMGGHVHQTHLISSRLAVPGPDDDPGIPLLACGTTASSRGRGPEAGRNTLNVVCFDEGCIEVTPHEYSEDRGVFIPLEVRKFDRRASALRADGSDGS